MRIKKHFFYVAQKCVSKEPLSFHMYTKRLYVCNESSKWIKMQKKRERDTGLCTENSTRTFGPFSLCVTLMLFSKLFSQRMRIMRTRAKNYTKYIYTRILENVQKKNVLSKAQWRKRFHGSSGLLNKIQKKTSSSSFCSESNLILSFYHM